jgi:hypothetical protein
MDMEIASRGEVENVARSGQEVKLQTGMRPFKMAGAYGETR